jgi:hypothetical protein
MFRHVGIMMLVVIVAGCASTKMQSAMYNPSGQRYTKILVFVPISDLIIRHEIETAIMKEFNQKPVTQAPSTFGIKYYETYAWMDHDTLAVTDSILYSCTQIAPLWDELSPHELDSILSPFGFDATLIVTPEAYWTTSTYIPKIASYYNVNLKASAGSVSGTIKESAIGGYTVTIPHWQFDTRIYGFADNKLIWKATSLSSGSKFDKNLPRSFAKQLAEKLQADLIVPKKVQIARDDRK